MFNVFMNVDYDKNGCHVIKLPVANKGDFIGLLAGWIVWLLSQRVLVSLQATTIILKR